MHPSIFNLVVLLSLKLCPESLCLSVDWLVFRSARLSLCLSVCLCVRPSAFAHLSGCPSGCAYVPHIALPHTIQLSGNVVPWHCFLPLTVMFYLLYCLLRLRIVRFTRFFLIKLLEIYGISVCISLMS